MNAWAPANTCYTLYVKIGGGDHQFVSHAIKPEDHLATISPDQQHMQIIKATSKMIQKVAEQ